MVIFHSYVSLPEGKQKSERTFGENKNIEAIHMLEGPIKNKQDICWIDTWHKGAEVCPKPAELRAGLRVFRTLRAYTTLW